MENQHRLIKGYRELSAHEINLMNELKAKCRELLEVAEKVDRHLAIQAASDDGCAEPWAWLAIGRQNVRTGTMQLIRAVAQPTDC